MEWIKADKGEKILFVIVNLALVAGCLRFLVCLVAGWSVMATNTRDNLGLFMVFFCFLWITLIQRGKNVFSLLAALLILFAVSQTATVPATHTQSALTGASAQAVQH